MKLLKNIIAAIVVACGFAVNAFAALPKVTVTETTRDADGHPTSFTLSFANFDASKSYPLYCLCSAEDEGGWTNGWAYTERLADIAPGWGEQTGSFRRMWVVNMKAPSAAGTMLLR